MFKKIFLSLACIISFLWITSAVQISIDPVFSDTRFEPADKLHAGCIDTTTVSLKTAKDNINSLRFIISYEPEKIQILDIKAASGYKDILDTTIEYDKIVVTLLDANIPNSATTKLFSLSFKSNENITGSILSIHKPSYVMTKSSTKIPVFVDQKLSFAAVPECEPDTIPPTITLMKPKDTTTPLALDSYFIFDIKDIGKGVSKQSLRVHFNGKTYSGADPVFSWQDNYLAFLPNEWIPIGTAVNLTITIGDLQSYGWANTTKKTFTFTTATGISFEHTFTPSMFRNVLGKMDAIYATQKECELLSWLIISSNFTDTSILDLSKKIWCSINNVATLQKEEPTKPKSLLFISVFTLTGWVLFFITFLLKIHYLVSYRKHKKKAKSLQSS